MLTPKTRELESTKANIVIVKGAEIQSQKKPVNKLQDALEECQKNGEALLESFGTIVSAASFFSNELYYMGCPKLGCGKKMTKLSAEDFLCSKCDEHFSIFKHQVLLRLNVRLANEIEKETEMVSFHTTSLKLLKTSLVEFAYLETNGKDELVQKFERLKNQEFKFVVKLKKNLSKEELQYIVDDVDTEACIPSGETEMEIDDGFNSSGTDGMAIEMTPSKYLLRKRKHI